MLNGTPLDAASLGSGEIPEAYAKRLQSTSGRFSLDFRGAWFANWSAPYMIRVLERCGLPLDENAVFADIGGGAAHKTMPFVQAFPCQFKVLDISPAMLSWGRERVEGDGRISFEEGSAIDTGLGDESVDAGLSSQIEHHLDDDEFPKSVEEKLRILKPGGILIYSDTHSESRVGSTQKRFADTVFELVSVAYRKWAKTGKYYNRPLVEVVNAYYRAGFEILSKTDIGIEADEDGVVRHLELAGKMGLGGSDVVFFRKPS